MASKKDKTLRQIHSFLHHKSGAWLYCLTVLVFLLALLLRLPHMSHGMDQWDVVLYKDSLVKMSFHREAQWPLLLLFQKGLWLIFYNLSAQQILSLTNIILSAATLSLLFWTVVKITSSYLAGVAVVVMMYFMPVFGVYSVVGMQDMPQTFAVMAFVAAIVQYCLSKRLIWLYAACAVAGLSLGVRLTLILILPSLIVTAILSKGLGSRQYLRLLATFIAGSIIGLAGNLFIPPLKNHSAIKFFLNQFHAFNPVTLGYWDKLGSYTLFSGYNLALFWWLPAIWFLIYLIAIRHRDKLKIGPTIALLAASVNLAVAYGLYKKVGKVLSPHLLLLMLVILIGCLILEALKSWPDIFKLHYFKKLNEREMATVALFVLIANYVIFNYIFTGPITRYLLPIIPASLLLALLLAGKTKLRSVPLVIVILCFSYWACSFGRSLSYADTFKKLDTRSSVAQYALNHKGNYYNTDPTEVNYLQSYGVTGILPPLTNSNCNKINTSQTNYAIFYGPITPSLEKSCSQLSFKEVAKYQRTEYIIEDSVGNIGYTVYKISLATGD